MQILMNTGGLAMTNCFLIADETARQAVLFDAPNDTVSPLLDEATSRGWDIIGLWLTHGHWDHLADHALVTSRFPNARVLIHPLDEAKLISPGSKMFPLPFEIPPRKADALVVDGQELSFGNLKVKVMSTPGHSPGHIGYYFPNEGVFVGGDLIIAGSVGRTDLPDASWPDLAASIRRVMTLPPATKLLPGHGEVSTLADEAKHNQIVREVLAGRSES